MRHCRGPRRTRCSPPPEPCGPRYPPRPGRPPRPHPRQVPSPTEARGARGRRRGAACASASSAQPNRRRRAASSTMASWSASPTRLSAACGSTRAPSCSTPCWRVSAPRGAGDRRVCRSPGPGSAPAGPADPLRGPSRLAPPSPGSPSGSPGVASVRGTGGKETRSNPRRSAAGLRPRRLAGRGNRCGLSAGAADQEALGQQLSPRCPFSPSRGIPGGGGVTGQVPLQLRPGATTIYNLRAGEAA